MSAEGTKIYILMYNYLDGDSYPTDIISSDIAYTTLEQAIAEFRAIVNKDLDTGETSQTEPYEEHANMKIQSPFLDDEINTPYAFGDFIVRPDGICIGKDFFWIKELTFVGKPTQTSDSVETTTPE